MFNQRGNAVADELNAYRDNEDGPFAQGALQRGRSQLMESNPQIRRPPQSAGLYDVLDLILDKGIVIDAFVRVSVVGIELLTVDLRVVIASVDTYLRYAEGVEKLQLNERSRSAKLSDVTGSGKGKSLKQGVESVKNAVTGDGGEGGDEDDEEEGVGEKLAGGVRHVLTKGVGRIMQRLSGDEEEQQEEEQGEQRRQRGDSEGQRDRGGQRSERRRGNGAGSRK